MPWAASDDQAEAPVFVLLTDDVLRNVAEGSPLNGKACITAENFALYVLECLWAVIEEKLEPGSFPAAVNAPGLRGPHSKTVSHSLWLAWADIEGPTADAFTEDPTSGACDASLGSPQATRLVSALYECRRQQLVDDVDLFEVLDLRLLVQSGLSTPSTLANSFYKKVNIARSSRTVKISLFNSFREDLEGYAKLVTLLNNPALTQSDQVVKICCEVDQLTGYYRLNPLKVCTCVLTAMERSPSIATMLVQVPYVVPSWCLEALKRRLKFSAASGSGGLTQNLFTAIAVMLKTNKLKLRDVLAQLAPEFDCLPSTKEAYEPLVTAMSAAARPASKGLYGENLDLDVTDRDTALTAALGDPAPVKLAQALIEHGEWLHALAVLKHSQFNLLAHRRVCCALLRKLLELLKSVPQSGAMPAAEGATGEVAAEFTPLMIQMLEVLGPLCFRRADVLTRVWRLSSHILSSVNASSSSKQAALYAVRHAALPASCFVPTSAAVWILAQECLFKIPQLQRCQMYGDMQALFLHPPIDHQAKSSLPPPTLMNELYRDHSSIVDRVLGTLAKKTRLPDGTHDREQEARHHSRIFQKVVMAHPFSAAQRLMELCRMYESHAPLLLYYSGGLLPVLQEIILFEAIRFLLVSHEKPRTSGDQASPADWLLNLMSFMGRLVAQASSLDVAQKLTIEFTPKEAVAARSQRFLKSLGGADAQGPSLLIACFVQLCQQRMKVCMTPAMQLSNNVRTMFEATQRTHAVVLHYIRLLTSMEVCDLVQALPGLPKLIGSCQIGPECAMAVYRPILRSLYKLSGSDQAAEGLLEAQNISLNSLVEDIKQCIPKLSSDAKFAFDPYFYILFWALELPDLAEDTEQKYSELNKELLAKLDSEKRGLKEMTVADQRNRSKSGSRYDGSADEPIVNQADFDTKKRKISEIQEMLSLVGPECEVCKAHSVSAIEVLKQHLDKCIPSVHGQQALSNAFMQECIMPRCVFSREDAMFCARVLLKFQTLDAANYSLPFMVNAVFGEVLCLLRACTLQETEYMSVFLKEVFMLLESTCTEEWLAQHPVIGQQTKHLTLVEWEKLQRKFQKRTCSTLQTFLLDESSDEVLQRNALKLLLNLLPTCPKREDDQKAMLATLDTLNARDTNTESVKMMMDSAKRNITRLRDDSQRPAAHADNIVDMAEDGEVPDFPEAGHGGMQSGGGGMGGGGGGSHQGASKRQRDASNDGHGHHRSARPRVDTSMMGRSAVFNSNNSNRQFGGTRGA